MDLIETDTVRPDDERPNRRDGTCFYCEEPIGGKHKPNCVIVGRSIVVKVTIDVVLSVPRNWTVETVDFHYNEGSWCADNLLQALGKWAEARGAEEACTSIGASCSCDSTDVEYLREATEDDHLTLPVVST